MKKIFLGMMAIALIASGDAFADGGGRKKAKKKAKAKIECKKDQCCDPRSCPKDDKRCDIRACEATDTCIPKPASPGNK